jgi:O-Antigen ligase.
LTYYLKIGWLVQIGIVILSFYYVHRKDELNLFFLFFTIHFLLPYEYNTLTLGANIGNYLGNSFIAGIPLYIGLPVLLKSKYKLSRNLKILLIVFFIIYFASTLLKGFEALLGGSQRVRIAWVINYFNIFVIVFWASRVLISWDRMKEFAQHLIILGFLIALFGLIQYIFKFYFIEYSYTYTNVERFSIIPYLDPVDLFPYLIVPLSFAFNYLFYKFENKHFVLLVTVLLLLSILFTWGRWGLFCTALTLIISLLLNKKIKVALFICAFGFFVYSFMSFDVFNIMPTDQIERLSSGDNLVVRMLLWFAAAYAIKENVFLGVGIGNSVEAYSKVGINISDFSQTTVINPNDFLSGQSIHQFYLDWILQMGIFIVPAIILLYWMFFKNTKTILKSSADPISLYVSKALICSVVGVSLFWMQNSGLDYFWLFLFPTLSYSIINIQDNTV